eukprot:scaffold3127_cov202-Prasinococcus_capsulatus_cf.AAC.5
MRPSRSRRCEGAALEAREEFVCALVPSRPRALSRSSLRRSACATSRLRPRRCAGKRRPSTPLAVGKACGPRVSLARPVSPVHRDD